MLLVLLNQILFKFPVPKSLAAALPGASPKVQVFVQFLVQGLLLVIVGFWLLTLFKLFPKSISHARSVL